MKNGVYLNTGKTLSAAEKVKHTLSSNITESTEQNKTAKPAAVAAICEATK